MHGPTYINFGSHKTGSHLPPFIFHRDYIELVPFAILLPIHTYMSFVRTYMYKHKVR